MLGTQRGIKDARRMTHVVSAASRSIARSNALAVDAGNVIAARTALMASAMTDPSGNAQAEIAMMVPEKTEAFSQAGEALVRHSGLMIHDAARYAGNEVMAAGAAGAALAACRSPLEWGQIHTQATTKWFDRAMSYMVSVSAAALRTHDATMKPIRQTASANAKRLKK